MTSVLTFVMLIVGGVALVIQNTLMAKITHSASTILIALVLNSAVGLVLLITLLAGKTGASGFYELFQSFKGWMLLPGILGSFFVFTGITGYQNIGARGRLRYWSPVNLSQALDMISTRECA